MKAIDHLKEITLNQALEVRPYEDCLKEQWENFIYHFANGNFIHYRSFLEYHGGRFEDASIMVWDGRRLMAVFPAHKIGNQIFSHNGLSFGGWIFKEGLNNADQKAIVKLTITFFKEKGIRKITIRPIPDFYWKDSNSLGFKDYSCLGFNSIEEKATFLLPLPAVNRRQISKRWKIRKSHIKPLEVSESLDYEVFWNNLLVPLYSKKIGITPVHTLEEICKLKTLFPNKIRLFLVNEGKDLLAGIVVFETAMVAKLQYIASSDEGKKSRSLDYLMDHIIKKDFRDKKFLDLGTVHHPLTNESVEGLITWKESWGAKPFLIPTYFIKLS